MKADLGIESEETTNNDQTNLNKYQYITEKLRYFICGIKPDI